MKHILWLNRSSSMQVVLPELGGGLYGPKPFKDVQSISWPKWGPHFLPD